jgi:hypothetical protein
MLNNSKGKLLKIKVKNEVSNNEYSIGKTNGNFE